LAFTCFLQDCPLKQSLLQQAADKLRSSAQFSRADAAPHNALGDVLMDAAELVVNLASSSSSSSSSSGGTTTVGATATGFGGAVPLPAAAAEQAAGLLKQAVDEGYMAALTISRTNADALVRRQLRRLSVWLVSATLLGVLFGGRAAAHTIVACCVRVLSAGNVQAMQLTCQYMAPLQPADLCQGTAMHIELLVWLTAEANQHNIHPPCATLMLVAATRLCKPSIRP
jgi:hypothetical protein